MHKYLYPNNIRKRMKTAEITRGYELKGLKKPALNLLHNFSSIQHPKNPRIEYTRRINERSKNTSPPKNNLSAARSRSHNKIPGSKFNSNSPVHKQFQHP